MLRIAIVEDQRQYEQSLRNLAGQFARRRGIEVEISSFSDGFAFLEWYAGNCDAVLMDILMPNMDGLETARRLREVDEDVPLIFITTVAQYAIRGYEVSAMGFMIKPVAYEELEMKLDKVLRLAQRRSALTWPITEDGVLRLLDVRSIQYVEVYNHSLIFHTAQGDHTVYGQLKALEADPRFAAFAKCSSSHLVNCAWVTEVGADALTAAGHTLPLSRRRRKAFLEKMTRVLGGSFG